MPVLSSHDQMGNLVELGAPPKRIISLVPSQTELLYDLGLGERVIGITKFCVHPEHWKREKAVVGGTKNFNLERIEELHPDLIIGNKEENYVEGIEWLLDRFPVWMSDIINFEDALDMIQSVSNLTDREKQGMELLNKIRNAFQELNPISPDRTLYLMWRNPWMGAASGTFIHALMQKIGLVNVLDAQERYPELSEADIKKLNPKRVVLSTEPFPFSEKHIPEIQSILPEAKIQIVDGEMFSWYGSRLRLAPAYFNSLELS